MPTETPAAVQWATTQTFDDGTGTVTPVTAHTPQPIVDAVRTYFNVNGIAYETFSYTDLQPYL